MRPRLLLSPGRTVCPNLLKNAGDACSEPGCGPRPARDRVQADAVYAEAHRLVPAPLHPPRRRKDGAVLFSRSSVKRRWPSIGLAQRLSRHHFFDVAGDEPFSKESVVALAAIARDAL